MKTYLKYIILLSLSINQFFNGLQNHTLKGVLLKEEYTPKWEHILTFKSCPNKNR